MRHGRKKPYSEVGVRRLPCVRCGKPAHAQWNVCADGPYRPIRKACDLKLNRVVLRFMKDPDAEAKIKAYEETLNA
jgi:hypothetical protein